MTAPAVELRGLCRRFGASNTALDGLDLCVDGGAVLGIVGPNGAGKTTLLNILATLVSPTSGSARVCGLDVMERGGDVRRIVGFASRMDAAGYGRLGMRDNLRAFGSLHGLAGRPLLERIDRLVDAFGAGPHADRPLQACSSGMRQRFNLMRALLNEPRVLLLDEPFHGLDGDASKAFADLLDREWRGRPDRAALLATPREQELGVVCDRIVALAEGRLGGELPP